MRYLILGDGLLGNELISQSGWDYISRTTVGVDFTDIDSYSEYLHKYDVIINCIGYCNTYDTDRDVHWDVNYAGVVSLVDFVNKYDKKLVHISTDYIYSNSDSNASEEDVPVHCNTWYGYTKLLSDAYVQLRLNDYLLIRGTHKETPFIYEKAYINQVGNFDYVNVIAKIIHDLIKDNIIGIYNVGTELKTMVELARKTKSVVEPTTKKFNDAMPSDISMDLTKLDKYYDK